MATMKKEHVKNKKDNNFGQPNFLILKNRMGPLSLNMGLRSHNRQKWKKNMWNTKKDNNCDQPNFLILKKMGPTIPKNGT